MIRTLKPIDFRTFVVFWMLSLTCLPMCTAVGQAGDIRNKATRVESTSVDETDPPPASAERLRDELHQCVRDGVELPFGVVVMD